MSIELLTGMEKLDFSKYQSREPKKSEVAEIVNAYCEMKGISKLFKASKEVKAKFPYPRMAAYKFKVASPHLSGKP